MDHSETAIWGSREGSSLFLHPPPAKGIKKFRYTHSVFGRRRKHAHIFKHPPPPTQAVLVHQKRESIYEKSRYRNRQAAEAATPRSRIKTVRHC